MRNDHDDVRLTVGRNSELLTVELLAGHRWEDCSDHRIGTAIRLRSQRRSRHRNLAIFKVPVRHNGAAAR